MNTAEKIKDWISQTLGMTDVVLVRPSNVQNGDFTLILRDGAEEAVEKLKSDMLSEIADIQFAKPMFINFFLKKEVFAETVGEAIKKGEKFGENKNLKGQKIIIEYTNCNVLKPFHIGHLMGNVIGESLSRIIDASGAEIKRDTYQGDVGLHIAETIWAIKNDVNMPFSHAIRMENPSEKINYLGAQYAYGAVSYADDLDGIIKNQIQEINKSLYEKNDEEVNNIYKWARKVSLDHFEELYKKLGTKFDYYFFESEISDEAIKIVKEFLKKGVFEESDGAIIFRGEKFDPKLHTRVFITKQGIPLYEAKDIAHALRKESEYNADQSIIVTANEQNEYFKVMLKALEQIRQDIAKKTIHFSHGILKLPSGKMSSRTGNVITGEFLINYAQESVLEKMKEREMSDAEKEKTAEIVAIGAIKYSILRQAIGGDIIFDFDKSLSFEGDSGPYLQYAFVRSQSVIRKAKEVGVKVSETIPDDWKTINLEKMVARFPEIVARAGKEFAPHHIVTYLVELASSFNNFYVEHKIADVSDSSAGYKLALTESFGIVMKKGLDLLGIKVPTEM